MTTPTPHQVGSDLDDIRARIKRLEKNYREAYKLGYEASQRGGSRGAGHSDPTGSVVAGKDEIRSKVKAAARAVTEAKEQLKVAEKEIRRAENRADPVSLERRRHEEKPVCRNCDSRYLHVNGLCRPCYDYERETGNVRPLHLIERQREREARKGRAS